MIPPCLCADHAALETAAEGHRPAQPGETGVQHPRAHAQGEGQHDHPVQAEAEDQ